MDNFPKVTKAQVVDLSKALARAEERRSSIGLQNVPSDPVRRVEMQAADRMAYDTYVYAKEQYNRAFDAWAKGGYQE